MPAYILLAVIALVLLLWPEFGRHLFFGSAPRRAIVRLVGLVVLLLLVWITFVQG